MNGNQTANPGTLRRFLCSLLMFCVVTATTPLPAQQASKAAPPPSSKASVDPGWPRAVTKEGTKLVYFQPQIDEWKDFRELTADVAVSLTPAGGQPVLGVASLAANTVADLDKRTVLIRSIHITSARFPSVEKANADTIEHSLRQVFPTDALTISLDRLLAGVQRSQVSAKPVAVKTDPPRIFFSKRSAILLMVDGEPVRAPIEKTNLEFLVNTNWDLFYEKTSKHYYLLSEKTWLSSAALEGPWAVTGKLPDAMAKLPANQNWDDVKKAIPPTVSPTMRGPTVFYASTPAEVIQVNGDPVYSRISGTQLVDVSNTENDLFFHSEQTQFYLLISGRWFRAKALEGPWSYAGNDLPPDFAKIPSTHPRSHVLASVPGTQEAQDAVMLAQIPTIAVVNRAEAEAKVKVAYDGTPQFKPVEQTSLQYATNTQDKVIKYGDLYYLCFQAVWFMSTTPNGPWKTADSVPK